VIINHGDGTYSAYWHIMLDGSLVKKGATVKTGEAIAKSGSTGYSSMSHLHFMVFKYSPKGYRETIPTKFYTSKGIIELKSYRSYRHPKNQ
jgi:murein DD-endopeptidase MepM/ murein hydrolase activator NlpD